MTPAATGPRVAGRGSRRRARTSMASIPAASMA